MDSVVFNNYQKYIGTILGKKASEEYKCEAQVTCTTEQPKAEETSDFHLEFEVKCITDSFPAEGNFAKLPFIDNLCKQIYDEKLKDNDAKTPGGTPMKGSNQRALVRAWKKCSSSVEANSSDTAATSTSSDKRMVAFTVVFDEDPQTTENCYHIVVPQQPVAQKVEIKEEKPEEKSTEFEEKSHSSSTGSSTGELSSSQEKEIEKIEEEKTHVDENQGNEPKVVEEEITTPPLSSPVAPPETPDYIDVQNALDQFVATPAVSKNEETVAIPDTTIVKEEEKPEEKSTEFEEKSHSSSTGSSTGELSSSQEKEIEKIEEEKTHVDENQGNESKVVEEEVTTPPLSSPVAPPETPDYIDVQNTLDQFVATPAVSKNEETVAIPDTTIVKEEEVTNPPPAESEATIITEENEIKEEKIVKTDEELLKEQLPSNEVIGSSTTSSASSVGSSETTSLVKEEKPEVMPSTTSSSSSSSNNHISNNNNNTTNPPTQSNPPLPKQPGLLSRMISWPFVTAKSVVATVWSYGVKPIVWTYTTKPVLNNVVKPIIWSYTTKPVAKFATAVVTATWKKVVKPIVWTYTTQKLLKLLRIVK